MMQMCIVMLNLSPQIMVGVVAFHAEEVQHPHLELLVLPNKEAQVQHPPSIHSLWAQKP